MLLPDGVNVYEDLKTSFTNFDEFLTVLKADCLTGVVQVTFNDYKAILFFESGNIIETVEYLEKKQKIGQEAFNGLYSRVKEIDGKILVIGYSAELVTMLAGMVKSVLFYKDFSGDFDKLLDSLKTLQHTGYIDILRADDVRIAMIFLHTGDMVESILSQKGKNIANGTDMEKILNLLKDAEVKFNVFQFEINDNKNKIRTTADIQPLLNFWEGLFTLLESKFKKDSFETNVNEVLLNVANDYPFLDPFRNQFRYSKGKISFSGSISFEFSEGLAKVMKQLLKKNSSIKKDEWDKLMQSKKNIITKYSLDNIVREIFE